MQGLWSTPRGVLAAVLMVCATAYHGASGSATSPMAPPEIPGKEIIFEADSGLRSNPAAGGAVVYDTVVGSEEAVAVRIYFSRDTHLRPGSQLLLTSLKDGAVQHLTQEGLSQWRYASAIFNGPRVRIQLYSGSQAVGDRVKVERLYIETAGIATESICGGVDNRISSCDRAVARMFPNGCTVWLINECFLGAGHCMSLGNTAVEFNIPPTEAHAPPSDQYAIDPSSVQAQDNGIGRDWGYFGTFPNTETGLTALQAQRARFTLAGNIPTVAAPAQDIRITGHGFDGDDPELSYRQQTSIGPFVGLSGTHLLYQTDATGGNSGSPVKDDGAGAALGIHTHGACQALVPMANEGTALNLPALQDALRGPLGACADQAACDNDGTCDPGEDCYNCVGDCIHNDVGPRCGNNICEIAGGEDCHSCPGDCKGKTSGPPSGQYCCGETVDCTDLRCTAGGNTCSMVVTGYCCGDGVCEAAETDTTCGVDCPVSCDPPGCDDQNACTADACMEGICLHTPVANGSACHDDACDPSICCSGACGPTCSNNAECNDNDTCTTDTCLNPGTCASVCSHHTVLNDCTGSFCQGDGTRCVANGTCGVGQCCRYDCNPDPPCTLPDPCPVDACSPPC